MATIDTITALEAANQTLLEQLTDMQDNCIDPNTKKIKDDTIVFHASVKSQYNNNLNTLVTLYALLARGL